MLLGDAADSAWLDFAQYRGMALLCTERGMSCHVQGPANVEAICRLVELGAKVAAVTEQSMLESPLHIAARCGRQDIVKRLIACNLPILTRTKVTSPAETLCSFFLIKQAGHLVGQHRLPGR